ncbi:MAG TPA: autorepressor SdpR family transcription factor [Pseudobacteroides sp.]|uniref:autorepressor SdpR family transcription factor n=1 Tax=Pseudobacteroides sp. TaxID=1968840 RepID=UPI002F926608
MGIQETFKALSDATRREIMNMLKQGRMTAGDIAARFSMTQPTVSHHLSVLKDAGLIIDRKEGKFIYYELNSSVIEDILGWFLNLRGDEK